MTPLALALALAAGPPESVSSLVDRVVETYGGRRAIAAFGARVEEGETTSLLHPGQRGRIRRVGTPGGSLRVEIRFPDGEEEVRVLHRGRGTRNGVDVTGSPPHAAMVLQAARLELPLLLQRGRRRIVDRGMQEREGRSLRVLELPLAGGLVVEADVDPGSGRILRSAGSSLDRVVQVTLLITDPADYAEINAEYVKHFPRGLPARHTARFGVPTTAKVAFACIALAGDQAS
jgi:hypothetical protein